MGEMAWSLSRLVVIFVFLVGRIRAGVFDVQKFGAIGDGKTDDTKAFSDAFSSACGSQGHNQILVPARTFVIGTIKFNGPCKGPIDFNLLGNIRAQPGPFDVDYWFGFSTIDQLKITGGGSFDGQGRTAWKYNDCNTNINCNLPTSIKLEAVTNSIIERITSLDSKLFHVNVDQCRNITFQGVHIVAPSDSPNTDGIHVGLSEHIKIYNTTISTGDDCISLGPGSEDIEVVRVFCGPGHGISIGSLGKYPDEKDVSKIRVNNCTISGAVNGLRMKSWATSLKSRVYDVKYYGIFIENVDNPIIIDQRYCPDSNCNNSGYSSVEIQDVWFEDIWGSSPSQVVVNLQCSRLYPCKNINFKDINLAYSGPMGSGNATCSNVVGSASGIQRPNLESCL